MITLKSDNSLDGIIKIKNVRTLVDVSIEEPEDCVYFLELDDESNNRVALSQIIEHGDSYQCLVFCSEEMIAAKSITAKIKLTNDSDTAESSSISVEINADSIRSKLNTAKNEELIAVRREIALLSKKIDSFTSGLLTNKIPTFDESLVEKGMMLTALGNGAYGMSHPFVDCINEINGKHSVNKKLTINASDICLDEEDTTLDDIVKSLRDASIEQSKMLKSLSEALTSMNNTVEKLDIALIHFTENN